MSIGATNNPPESRPPVPLYHQLYVSLREKVLSGQWKQGDLLPSEQEISKAFGVSRVTVRRALDLLEREHLLRRFQGRGSFVSPKVVNRPVTANISGQLDNALGLGRQTSVALVAFDYIRAPADAQQSLRCGAEAQIQWSVRIRLLDGTPMSHVTTYVPEDVGNSYRREDLLSSAPILSLIERHARIGHADQVISATLADERLSEALKVPIGAPLLEIQRVVLSDSERPIMHSRALYNPDHYSYRLSLEKPERIKDARIANIYD